MSAPARAPKLGIIAGGGALPGLLARACHSSGRPYFILGLTGFADDAALPRPADSWVKLGEAGKGFDALRGAGVGEVVMAGAVQRPKFSELKTDFKGAAMLARIAGRAALGDDSLLSAVVSEIESEGFKVVGADSILFDLLTPAGVLGRHAPDAKQRGDIAIGFAAARALGRADIGQAVVCRDGTVIASEGPDGTDAMLARVKGGILVKVKKPQQERRVDLPTVGPATVKSAIAAGMSGIAVEAGHTFMIDRVRMVALADEAGLFIAGVTDGAL
ncbi:MAG: LpxI family protein [Rhodospirillaceae bacterium]